jgi:membrane protein DedA with SNARE-associated domain
MRYWVGVLMLCTIGCQFAFANSFVENKPDKSPTIIILGVLVLLVIFIMLIKKQKRRFND